MAFGNTPRTPRAIVDTSAIATNRPHTYGPFFVAPYETLQLRLTSGGGAGAHFYVDVAYFDTNIPNGFGSWEGFVTSTRMHKPNNRDLAGWAVPVYGNYAVITVDLNAAIGGNPVHSLFVEGRYSSHSTGAGFDSFNGNGIVLAQNANSVAAGGTETSFLIPYMGPAAISWQTTAAAFNILIESYDQDLNLKSRVFRANAGTPNPGQAPILLPGWLNQISVTNNDGGARTFDIGVIADIMR